MRGLSKSLLKKGIHIVSGRWRMERCHRPCHAAAACGLSCRQQGYRNTPYPVAACGNVIALASFRIDHHRLAERPAPPPGTSGQRPPICARQTTSRRCRRGRSMWASGQAFAARHLIVQRQRTELVFDRAFPIAAPSPALPHQQRPDRHCTTDPAASCQRWLADKRDCGYRRRYRIFRIEYLATRYFDALTANT